MSAGKILVVDDDPQIRRVMKATLVGHSYEVIEARTGEEALEVSAREMPNLVLLDMNMPGMGGLETCRALRAALRHSGHHSLGAQYREGQSGRARCRRRRLRHQALRHRGTAGAHPRRAAPLARLRPKAARARSPRRTWRSISTPAACAPTARTCGSRPRNSTLLRYLVAHAGKPVTHRELLQAVWGPDYGDEPEYLRVFINQVRKKIEPNPAKPKYILTEPWVGYRFAG